MQNMSTPTYQEIERRMEDYVSTKTNNAEMRASVFAWMSEFGVRHYECMCTILQGFRDRLNETALTALVKENGRIIYDMGGHTAMVANFYIYANFIVDQHTERSFITPVEIMWNGVGTWLF